jgi:hypothetical protein
MLVNLKIKTQKLVFILNKLIIRCVATTADERQKYTVKKKCHKTVVDRQSTK